MTEGTPGPRWGCGRAVPCGELIPTAALVPDPSPTAALYLIRDRGRPKSLQKIKQPELSQVRGRLGNQSKWAFLLLLSAFPCLSFHLGQRRWEWGGRRGWRGGLGPSGVPRRERGDADGDLS